MTYHKYPDIMNGVESSGRFTHVSGEDHHSVSARLSRHCNIDNSDLVRKSDSFGAD